MRCQNVLKAVKVARQCDWIVTQMDCSGLLSVTLWSHGRETPTYIVLKCYKNHLFNLKKSRNNLTSDTGYPVSTRSRYCSVEDKI